MFGICTTILTGNGQVCSSTPKEAKVTNLQYILRIGMLDCYDLLHAGRLTLRLNLDPVVQHAQPTMSLGVTIHYLLLGSGMGLVVMNVGMN